MNCVLQLLRIESYIIITLELKKIKISVNQGKKVRLSYREVGISDHMYYKWHIEYGGLSIDQARDPKKLKETCVYRSDIGQADIKRNFRDRRQEKSKILSS